MQADIGQCGVWDLSGMHCVRVRCRGLGYVGLSWGRVGSTLGHPESALTYLGAMFGLCWSILGLRLRYVCLSCGYVGLSSPILPLCSGMLEATATLARIAF